MAIPNNNFSIFTILEIANNNSNAINFLQNKQLIRDNENCHRCGRVCVLSEFADNINVGYVLRCPFRGCRARKSLIVGTFFENLHFPLYKYIVLIYYWASKTPINIAAQHLQISENSIGQHYNFIREVCSWKLCQNPIRLGGLDQIVQIDESLFAKAKNNVGHALQRPQCWVFGIYDIQLKIGYMHIVYQRDHDTLLDIIRRVILPGSIIYSDQWAAYNYILNDDPEYFPHPQPYRHATVNHSHHFVDPLTGVHTNHVEAMWSRCKKQFKQMNGTTDDSIPSYIDEFMWRQRYAPSVSVAFENILLHISQQYPL